MNDTNPVNDPSLNLNMLNAHSESFTDLATRSRPTPAASQPPRPAMYNPVHISQTASTPVGVGRLSTPVGAGQPSTFGVGQPHQIYMLPQQQQS